MEYPDLEVEIARENGRAFLVVRINDEKNLPLIDYQVEMLMNNRVPGLLPLELRRNDRLLALYYHLEGFTVLTGYLQAEPDAAAMLDVLDSILQALWGSQDYLLNLESFVLEEELIFVRPGTAEVGLVYVPAALENNAEASLSELTTSIAGHLPDNQGEIKAGLLQTAWGQDLTLSKMQKALNRLRLCNLPGEEPRFSENSPERNFREFWGDKASGAGSPPRAGQILTGLWRRVKDRAGHWLERVGPGPVQPYYQDDAAYTESEPARNALQQFGPLIGGKDGHCQHYKDDAASAETVSVRGRQRYSLLAGEGDVCAAADGLMPVNRSPDTSSRTSSIILLENNRQDTHVHRQHRRYPVLKIRQSNGEETVVLDRDDFCLGRSRALADYWVDDNRLLGRVHARIVRREGSYHLIDLHSRNGTYLNGKRLEPALPAPLRPGDLIQLANLEIRFEN